MMVVSNANVIGQPISVTQPLLSAIGCGELDPEETLARIIWSHLTEPGDSLAGRLIQTLGAREALLVIRARNPVLAILGALTEADPGHAALTGVDAVSRDGELAEAASRWVARDNNAAVLRSIQSWARLGGFVITPDSQDWPARLADLDSGAPHVLWIRGNRDSLGFLDASVAVVGSRNITSYGQYAAQTISQRLAEEGFMVVSGGAYGVDAEAHRGALAGIESAQASVQPTTIAVMAGGGDRLYPVGNNELLREIMLSGCVMAELPPGNAPTRWRFLQRNRLIAALGQATVVIEMAIKSGAKNTMHHALAMGRDVYAMPGPIFSQTARGCNLAIAQNFAKILTGVDELVAQLRGGEWVEATPEQGLSQLQVRIADALSGTALSVARIASKAGTTTRETTASLGELELLGLAERSGVGWRKRVNRQN